MKPWGYEELLNITPNYVVKRIVIKAKCRLSQQYHEVKEETIIVESGTLICLLGVEESPQTLRRGAIQHIPPRMIHRFSSNGRRVSLIETSTPQLNDVVRLKDDYNRI